MHFTNPHFDYLYIKAILLPFLKKSSFALLYRVSMRCSPNKSVSNAIHANWESPVRPVVFMPEVLIPFGLRHPTEAVAEKKTSFCS